MSKLIVLKTISRLMISLLRIATILSDRECSSRYRIVLRLDSRGVKKKKLFYLNTKIHFEVLSIHYNKKMG